MTDDFAAQARDLLEAVVAFYADNKTAPKRMNSVAALAALLALHQAELERAEKQARVEEIEDIDQSRDVVEDEDGFICNGCESRLEYLEQECACNIIYQKRKQRLDALRGGRQA